MDREHFTRLIQEPVRVQRDDIADLKAMTERYPWFSAAHLLLAVGEHRQGDVLFDEQLRTSAAHLPSRAVLFDLVHPIEPPPQPLLRVVAKEGTVKQEEGPPVAAAVAETMAVVVDEDTMLIDAPAARSEAVPQVEAHPSPAPVIEEAPAAEVPPARTEEAADPLDVQMRQAALASSYELLLADTIPIPEPEPIAPPRATGRMSFRAWLEDQPATSASRPRDTQPVQPVTDPAAMAATKALIDRFIHQATPPPPAKKAEFFSPQQAAKRSLEDHADMVTETLARIYEKQGNLAKARAAYARLAEKHPDRRDHFLGLARALEQR